MGPPHGLSMRERFMRHVSPEPNTGCWLWEVSCRPNGYGQFAPDGSGRPVHAHRAAYELLVGTIPEGMQVCHRCDVRSCVNPDHLFLGTQKDNVDDMRAKGRAKWGAYHKERRLARSA